MWSPGMGQGLSGEASVAGVPTWVWPTALPEGTFQNHSLPGPRGQTESEADSRPRLHTHIPCVCPHTHQHTCAHTHPALTAQGSSPGLRVAVQSPHHGLMPLTLVLTREAGEAEVPAQPAFSDLECKPQGPQSTCVHVSVNMLVSMQVCEGAWREHDLQV